MRKKMKAELTESGSNSCRILKCVFEFLNVFWNFQMCFGILLRVFNLCFRSELGGPP